MKVFGTGLQRTGLTSLAKALNLLSIKTIQFPKDLYFDIGHDIIREFDGFTDNPIPLLFNELDAKHPNSKFIHTIRDEKKWIQSVRWLFTTGSVKFNWQNNPIVDEFHMKFYGTTTFDENLFLHKYRTYNQDVKEYFANRPDDFLILDIEQGEGFEKLCPFLDKQIPNTPFPHSNKREGIWKVKCKRLFFTITSKITHVSPTH